MKADHLLIVRPERHRGVERTVFGVLTAVAWVVYAYLWLPLITFGMWALGVRSAALELYLTEREVEPFLILALPIIAGAAALLLIGWAEYNRLRFRGKERRRRQPDVSTAAVAAALGSSLETARTLQAARCVILPMSGDAYPLGILPES